MRSVVVGLLVLLGTSGLGNAQTVRSSIVGLVQDSSEKPIARASVAVTHLETGRTTKVLTSDTGEFAIPLLALGDYKTEVEYAGFLKYSGTASLLVNQEVRMEVKLHVAAPSGPDRVTVTAARSLLKTENASLGAIIDNKQLATLPLDGRNFLELSLLVPGAVPAAQGSAASVRGDFAFNINGAREDSNNFLLDGVYNGDPKLNTFSSTPAVDAVREFEVVSSTYDASFGRNGGGQINVVTQSGANKLHGSLYEFFRNSTMDARNFFAPATEKDPRYQRNQFGVSLGGALVKNKTFFFADYEGRRSREGITRVTNVPTALERSGDFTQSGLPYIIDPFTQQPFAGNKIPQQRIHPNGGAIAALYPLPNRARAGQNFVSSPIEKDRNEQFDLKLDHQLSQGSDLSVRYSFSDRSLYEPFSGTTFAAIPGYGGDIPRRSQNLMLGHTHAFSPSLLNEVRVAFVRTANQVLQQNRDTNLNAKIGLPSTWTKTRDNGLTFITLPGYSSIGDEYNNPQRGIGNTFQVLDHATLTKGRHLAKFGFEYRKLQQNAFRDIQSRGFINFYGFLGSSMVDLLQGLPVVSGYGASDNPQYVRSSSINFFVNDNWRITPKFTLNFGARYEYNQPAKDKFNRANLFDPAKGTLVPVGVNGFPAAGYEADRNNLAPRIGFSWLMSERAATIVRGGYGVYYDASALAPSEGLYFSPPYFNFKIFQTSQAFPLLLHDPFPANYPYPTPPSASAFQRDLKTPYMQHWNLNVQHMLGDSRMFEIGYVGSKGTKLYSARDINQANPSTADFALRPNFFFQDVNIMESRSNSNYHSLQARFQQRFSSSFSALASYTYGKSIDDASGFFTSSGDPNFPQDSRNTSLERGRSNFDMRQRFSAAYVWSLPLGKGLLRSGWETACIWSFQTGRPFTVALLSELDNSGSGRSALGFGANDRPHVAGPAALSNPTPERWFDTAAFRMPARGTFGNAGRNILDGDGSQVMNMSLLKNFTFAESHKLQLRVEAFNLLNHTNFDLPDNFFGSPTFGRVSSAQSPRHVQLGVKYVF